MSSVPTVMTSVYSLSVGHVGRLANRCSSCFPFHGGLSDVVDAIWN